MKLHPQVEHYSQSVGFYLVEGGKGAKGSAVGRSVVMGQVETGEMMEPTFRLDLDDTQEMFEQLWAQGFRSKHDKGNFDKLDAARLEHLADLRKAAKLG